MTKKTIYALLLALFAVLSCQRSYAQINPELVVSGNTIYVRYNADTDYLSSPNNKWGAQHITLKYPDTITVYWNGMYNLSSFNFYEDALTSTPVSPGDGYTYKTFSTGNGDNTFNISSTNEPIDVFFSYIYSDSDVRFELSSTSTWQVINNRNLRITNNGMSSNVFGSISESTDDNKYDITSPTVTISSPTSNPTNASPIEVNFSFSEEIQDFTESDLNLLNGTVDTLIQITSTTYVAYIIPYTSGTVSIYIPELAVFDNAYNYNSDSEVIQRTYISGSSTALATYHLEGLNDGYYQVSLVPHITWTGTNAITATGQVTIKAGTSTDWNDRFRIDDLTMMHPDVRWEQNSRYDAPSEDPAHDYISFGLVSNGTQDITFTKGDTVPLFRFKNTGICSEDSVFLMSIIGDPFAWPNSLNANVGQQLSVSGYNEPDVPLAVSGIVPCMAEVLFCFKAALQGPYSPSTGLMNDDLRIKDYIPTIEPYRGYQPLDGFNYFPFQHVDDGGGETVESYVFDNTGSDAIVDWVMIELRNQHDSTEVLSTRSALLQRDGDIVELDGYSSLQFRKLKSNHYFFSVRHRNHLGLMSAEKIQIYHTYDYGEPSGTIDRAENTSGGFSCANTYDFTDLNNTMHGTYAGHPVGSRRLMWAGNSNADNYIMFQGGGIGQGLDIDNVFHNIISDFENQNYSYNHVRNGYHPGDNNLDGFVKYQGPANDVDPFIFFNIISRHPGNANKYVNFYITEQLPRD
jgi:hypothetical protein